MSSSYAKSIKTVKEMSRRFLGHVYNPAEVPTGRKYLKWNRFNFSSYYVHTRGMKPYDQTGLFLSRTLLDRIESRYELKITGRGPPKKGHGKQAQLAAGKKKK
jgi:hypothetical protein